MQHATDKESQCSVAAAVPQHTQMHKAFALLLSHPIYLLLSFEE
jgi:hypothetical protein